MRSAGQPGGLLGDEWLSDGQTVSLRYAASPESIEFGYPGVNAAFAAADRYTTTPYRRYAKDGDQLAVGWADLSRSGPLKYRP